LLLPDVKKYVGLLIKHCFNIGKLYRGVIHPIPKSISSLKIKTTTSLDELHVFQMTSQMEHNRTHQTKHIMQPFALKPVVVSNIWIYLSAQILPC